MHRRLSATKLDDEQLLAMVRNKDAMAMEALYGAYYERLRATTIHFLGHDDAEGEDAVQETFAVALKKLPRTKIQTNLYGWLNRICTLLCYERLRRRKRALLTEEEGLLELLDQRRQQGRADQLQGLEDEELRAVVLEGIKALGEPCSSILTLREIDELSYAEVSKRLRIPLGTVMSRLLRCRQALAKRLRKKGFGAKA